MTPGQRCGPDADLVREALHGTGEARTALAELLMRHWDNNHVCQVPPNRLLGRVRSAARLVT